MPEWLQELGPEYYILFGFALFSFILVVIVLIMQTKTNKILINRSIVIKDSIHKNIHGLKVVVDLANQSYVNSEIVEVGFFYKKTFIPIYEERFIIAARDFFKVEYSAEELRTLLLGNKTQVKKLFVYIKNTVGDVIRIKAKYVRKHLINTIKAEIKLAKQEAKKLRFETGNYNFFERFGLVMKFIFSPFYRLFKLLARKTNESMKRRQARLEAKRKIESEQKELREKETEQMVAEIEIKEREKFQKKLEREEKQRLENEQKMEAKKLQVETQSANTERIPTEPLKEARQTKPSHNKKVESKEVKVELESEKTAVEEPIAELELEEKTEPEE